MHSGAVTESARRHVRAGTGAEPARILAIGNMYPPHHAGGYELAWQQAARRAAELGHVVRVLTTDYRKGGTTAEEDPDVHRTLRWYWDLDRYEFPALSPREQLTLERHNSAEFRRHLAGFRPDVVAWWSMGCMSLGLIEQARRRRLPSVFLVHDDWVVYGPERDQWIRTWQGPRRGRLGAVLERVGLPPTRVTLNGYGRWVFNSRYTLERAAGAGLDVSSGVVVHPGVDERFLEPHPAREWRWRLLCVGRLDRQKGVDTAIAALSELPAEASLDIWGTGEARYTDELRALARRAGASERVRFHGFASARELPAIYADADAVLFPVRWQEPFGLVPLEAMGIGRPVVTTARGGTAEYVRDGVNALVFGADDPAALAGCLRRLAADPDLRARLRSSGARTAASFPQARFAQATVQEMLAAA